MQFFRIYFFIFFVVASWQWGFVSFLSNPVTRDPDIQQLAKRILRETMLDDLAKNAWPDLLGNLVLSLGAQP